MKLQIDPRKVVAGGVLSTTEFTIKGGAGIMAVLSGLYSEPVLAMTREYLTNMVDAHTALRRVDPAAADKAPSPRIAVPSNMSPELVFEDFGIGMSLQTVLEVYTQYGNSTKNGSNDEVGGFGLGSKTAFCYNNGSTWTIESRHAGQKHVFMACVSETGIPSLAHVSTEPSAEHTGVTIRVPILRVDFDKARAAVVRFAPFFPLPLNIDGMEVPDLWKGVVMEGNQWKVVTPQEDRSYYNATGKVFVVMGNVPYVVEGSAYVKDDAFTRWIHDSKKDLYLFAPIGSLNLVPSRDALQYNTRTTTALTHLVDAFIHDLRVTLSKKLSACTTKWDAIVVVNEMTENGVIPSGFPLTWKGEDIRTTTAVEVSKSDLLALDPTAESNVLGITDSYKAQPGPVGDGNKLVLKAKYTYLLRNDVKIGEIGVARQIIQDNLQNRSGNRSCRYGHKIGHVITLKTVLTDQQISELFQGFPVENIYHASALVKARVKRVGGGRRTGLTYVWNRWGFEKTDDINEKDNVHYYLPLTKVERHRRFAWRGHDYGSMNYYVVLAKKILGLGEDHEICGIREDRVKKLDSSWVNLEVAVAEALVKEINAKPAAYAAQLLEMASEESFLPGLERKTLVPLFSKAIQESLTKKDDDQYRTLLCESLQDVSVLFKNVLTGDKKLAGVAKDAEYLFGRAAPLFTTVAPDKIVVGALVAAVKTAKLPETSLEAWGTLALQYPLVSGLVGLVASVDNGSKKKISADHRKLFDPLFATV